MHQRSRVGLLQFCREQYAMCCSQVEVHGKALVGYPLLALATVQFTEASACTWQWFRSSTAVSSPRSRKPVPEWLSVSADGPRYVPIAADEGCVLRVTCRPPPAQSDTVRAGALGCYSLLPLPAAGHPSARA